MIPGDPRPPAVRAMAALEHLQRRWRWSTEASLHEALATVLGGAGVPFRREVELGAGRIDFVLWEDVGLEVKVDGPTNAVLRQLHRYAEDPELRAVVLATTLRRHLEIGGLTTDLSGKPLFVIHLRGWP